MLSRTAIIPFNTTEVIHREFIVRSAADAFHRLMTTEKVREKSSLLYSFYLWES